MKITENTITMLGENMQVFVGAGCLSGCDSLAAAQLPSIISGLCETLPKRQVARAFMHHVRIGNTIALVDKEKGCSFRLKMEPHSVCVLGIQFTATPPKSDGQVFYLVNSRLWQRHGNRSAVAA